MLPGGGYGGLSYLRQIALLSGVTVGVEETAIRVQLESPVTDHARCVLFVENPSARRHSAWLVKQKGRKRLAINVVPRREWHARQLANRGIDVGEVRQRDGPPAGD